MPCLEALGVGGLKAGESCILQCIPQEFKDKLSRRVSYVLCYNCNIKNLEDKIKDLRKVENEVKTQVDAEETNGNIIKHEVWKWLEETANLLRKFDDKIKKKLDYLESTDCICCCDSACEIGEMTDDIENLLKRPTDFQIVSYSWNPVSGSSLYNMKNPSVLSRQQTMEKILEALKGGNNNIITICGLPGAGKTTMLKNTVIQCGVSKLFDVITEVIDSVSETPADIKMIQNSVAYAIKLSFSEQDSEEVRPVRLHKQLKSSLEKKKKRILVVFDDIMDPDIEKLCKRVGIPFPPDAELRILMSSRKVDGNSHFLLDCLDEEEARSLFRDGLRSQIPDEEYQEFAASTENDVLQKCQGLPSAITEVSDVIKLRWGDRDEVVRQLKHRNLSEVDDVDQRSYKSVKRSYELLKMEEKKKLFLLISCLLRPGAITVIEDFMRYGIGLYLFQRVENLQVCRVRFDRWVDDMKSLSLFENMDGQDSISIHNIIRESAISIASDEGYLLLEEGSQLFVNYEKYTIISTSVHGLQDLAGRELPKLEALLLKEKSSLVEDEDKYFTRMNKLRVLGLSEIRLSRLPSSIEHLKDLVILSVENCDIELDASLISELPRVRVLSLRGSKIKVFPRDNMGGVILLDLTDCCFKEEVVGDVVANSYHSLKGLYMCGCRFADDATVEVVTETLVGRLRSLEYALEIEIPSACLSAVDGDLVGEKLKRFKVAIGCKVCSSFKELYLYKQVMFFEKIDARLFERKFLLCLLKKTECLRLVGIGNLDKVIISLGSKLGKLKWLHISHCGGMKKVVNTQGFPADHKVFPELEVLWLEQLGSLEVIYYHELAPQNWCSNLRELKLSNLSNLKHISAFATHRDITESSGEVNDFPCLKKLELQSLPQLNGLCVGETGMGNQNHQLFHDKINLPALEELSLSNLDKIKELWKLSLTVPTTTFSVLKMLKLDTMPGITHVWSEGLCQGSRSFRSLQKIDIIQCANLKSLCPPTVAAALLELESLEITSCGNLEEVIVKETNANPTSIKFSSMQRLKLESLPSLRCFFHGSHIVEFPSLKTLILCSLPMMSTFHITPTNAAGAQGATTSTANQTLKIVFPSLEDLELKDMYGDINKLAEDGAFPKLKNLTLENVGLKDITETILNKLQQLQLHSCGSLGGLPWASLLQLRSLVIHGGLLGMRSVLSYTDIEGNSLPQLQDIEIEGCEQLEEIVSNIVLPHSSSISYGATMFPQLKHIKLHNLPILTTFSSGSSEATFRALEKVEIYTCPSLESFSLGKLHTSNLKSVQVDDQISTQSDINLNDFLRINRNRGPDRDIGKAPGEIDRKGKGKAKADDDKHNDAKPHVVATNYKGVKIEEPQNPTELTAVPAKNQQVSGADKELSITAVEDDEAPRDIEKAPVEIDRKGKGKAKAGGDKDNDAKPHVVATNKGVKIQEPQNPNTETPGPQDVPASVEEESRSSVGDLAIGLERNGEITTERADEGPPGQVRNCSEEQQICGTAGSTSWNSSTGLDAGTTADSESDAGTTADSESDAGTTADSESDAGTAVDSDSDAGTVARNQLCKEEQVNYPKENKHN